MNLCTPATIYLVLSAIGIIMIAFQNYGKSPNMYCVGNVQCPVQNTTPLFIMKILSGLVSPSLWPISLAGFLMHKEV